MSDNVESNIEADDPSAPFDMESLLGTLGTLGTEEYIPVDDQNSLIDADPLPDIAESPKAQVIDLNYFFAVFILITVVIVFQIYIMTKLRKNLISMENIEFAQREIDRSLRKMQGEFKEHTDKLQKQHAKIYKSITSIDQDSMEPHRKKVLDIISKARSSQKDHDDAKVSNSDST